ncbi:MAG: site-2 protease family protein [Cyanophyceae cyanobacterium]
MFNGSQSTAVLFILLVVAIQVWGFNRARAYGKPGILAWLQSVVLLAPWVVFFGLLAAGIYINIVGIIFLLVASAGAYIWIGRQVRTAGQERLKEQAVHEPTAELPQPPTEAETVAPESEVPPIDAGDLKLIQGIFGIDTFFATETIAYQEGAIFKGNLRGDPETVHSRLSAKLQQLWADKYHLFLVESPEGKPVVIVLPSSNGPQPATLAQKNLALVLLVATVATTLEAGGLLLGFDWFSELGRYQEALPLSLGLWSILLAHELGHFFVAKRYQVRLSLPYFLPSWQIGSFGAIARFESLLPHRTALFDIALAGPACGGIVSLVLFVIGLLLSRSGSLFQVPTQLFQGSILVGGLARAVLGSALEKTLVDLHPLTVIGWLGLVITALNLLPAGQLDGGRILQAIYGRKVTRRATIATLVALGIVALINPNNPIPLYWGIVILFLQRDLERPSLNELTEPDDARAAWGLLALFLMLATLIPLSPSLAGRLGIGG